MNIHGYKGLRTRNTGSFAHYLEEFSETDGEAQQVRNGSDNQHGHSVSHGLSGSKDEENATIKKRWYPHQVLTYIK